MWSAILARAFYMLSVFLGRPCGHPLEIAFYNSCHLKLLVSQATSASVIQTGLHSILQFQVTFPAYNLLVTRPQRLADRVFQYSLSRDPVNNFLLYGQAFPQYELTSRHKLASAVLPGLHRLYYGTACLEACRYRIDTPGYDGIRLLTSSAPVLVTIAEQTEYENQLEAIEDMPAIVRCGSHLRDPRNYTEFEKAEDAQASLEIEIRKAQLRI